MSAGACLMVGAVAMSLSGNGFSLHWTHSVEKITWSENWVVMGHALQLVEAKVKGSGAGMEPGEGAVLQDGWWVWSPMTRVPELRLAASGATGAGWTLCDGTACHELGAEPGEALMIAPCQS
ncbi:DUF1850 domain-containing protein [Thioclava sp. FR2]|uniref:DUF1850 domain-containing protein n=1 Tax=Thioclava sp. FR2 TaxID=3445780 RepID=UPI003EC05A07